MDERFFYYLASVPILGILAQWLAWRFKLPSILLLLGFGILLGEALGLNPDSLLQQLAETEAPVGPRVLFPLVTLCVAVILFEGGLSLQLRELRESGAAVLTLCTVGVLISWIATTFLSWWLFDFNYLRVAALIGAVLVVTGPTVVAPLLRHIRPKRNVASVIKWEGIVVDPIGAVLAVLVFEYGIALHAQTSSMLDILKSLFMCTVVASSIGIAAAMFLIFMVKRFLIPDFLHSVVFLATILGAFVFANWLHHESGLVTVTVLGIVLANQKSISINHVIEFKEGLGVLLISCLFIVLGSRVSIAEIGQLGYSGLIFLGLLIVLVRPLSVMLSTIGTGMKLNERVFVSFMAPRGIVAAAVTAVFALRISSLAESEESMTGMLQDADKLVPITFVVIIGTVAIYGLAASPLAKRLNLSDDNPQGLLFAGADDFIREIAKSVQDAGVAVQLIDTNHQNVTAARIAGLRAECASIISEHVIEETELSGIGRLVAMTPNDELNAMATNEYEHVFTRANVFQLAPEDNKKGPRASISSQHQGRILFGPDVTYTRLASLFDQGWVAKTTKLTAEFNPDDFFDLYGDDLVVLFAIDESGQMKINTMRAPLVPEAGQTIIALVDPSRKEQRNNGSNA